jgi:ribA/ribD-fused uncharacterized protein
MGLGFIKEKETMKYKSELLGATIYPKENLLFFYGGIFSQWASGQFHCYHLKTDVNCAEQAMMLSKAKTFNDMDAYERILLADHPRDQKFIGRNVQNYNEKIWSEVRYKFVLDINRDKFTQAKAWKELLLLTHPYLLVEASPSDKIWGIGLGEDNENVLKREIWGLNLLGKAITEVREELINN